MKDIRAAAWPVNFQAIDFGIWSEAKMGIAPVVALISAAAVDLIG